MQPNATDEMTADNDDKPVCVIKWTRQYVEEDDGACMKTSEEGIRLMNLN